MAILYSLRNVTLTFPVLGKDGSAQPVCPLNDLSLDINAGEYLVILGANGCGKSSLARLLAGLSIGSVTGQIIYKGQLASNIDRESFPDSALVLQEPQNQLLMPTVAEELAFPLRNCGYDKKAIDEKIREMAEFFELKTVLDEHPDELSGGQITTLALASALITDPEMIILDEPDSHLDARARTKLLAFVASQRGARTIILITQFPQLARAADRVALMSNGSIAAEGPPSRILSDEDLLRRHNIGMLVDKPLRQRLPSIPKRRSPLISLQDVSFEYEKGAPVLNGITLEIHAGENVGLVGFSGSGKTTLGLVIAGFLRPQAGGVMLGGHPIDSWPPKQLRRQVTMAMQFPERALFAETVEADVAFGPGNMGYEKLSELTEAMLWLFGIEHLRNRHPFSISGGEKRKAALAGILAMKATLTILDEPSAALDPSSARNIVQFINSGSVGSLIVISHDLDLIGQTCDRVIGLENGRVICDLTIDGFFGNRELRDRLAGTISAS